MNDRIPNGLPDLSRLVETILAVFASPFSQEHRIVRLDFASDSGIAPDTLIAHRVTGHEALSEPGHFTVETFTADSFLELKELIGQGVAIDIHTAEGQARTVTGIVTRASHEGSNGGMARILLEVEPAFATLRERINSRTFQDKNVKEIVGTILQEHIADNPVFAKHFTLNDQTRQTYPKRSYCQQYNESDKAFIERLLAEEGISYTWDYNNGEAPMHAMVLFDDTYALAESAQSHIRFHRADATEKDDTITQWNSARKIGRGSTAVDTRDYKRASMYGSSEQTGINHGEDGNALASTLTAYAHQASYYGADESEMQRYAQLRQQAADLAAKTFTGSGTVRALGLGEYFELRDHPVHDQDYQEDREFTVCSLDWVAQNNLPEEASNKLQTLFPAVANKLDKPDEAADPNGASSKSPYLCRFNAVRRGIPIVPVYSTTDHAKPTAIGPQTATVVGPAGEEIYTDEYGRIKVQFPWQRRQDHPEGGAEHDDKSATWMRVATHSADAGWGTQHIPRIGAEVLIAFLENDIDRPICIRSIHNGIKTPPAFSGAGSLPANKALSGTKTKEYKGSQYNELLFDDTTNELRTKLSSEHAKTQINQGYLIHPRTEGKGEPRGEGFELRTDAAGAIRAAQGLLLSAEAQNGARGRQLERQLLLHMLDAALAMAEQLGEHAAHQHANLPETGKDNKLVQDDAASGMTKEKGHQTHLKDALENLERGSNTDKDGKSGSGKQAGRQGIVAITAPDGIAIATSGSSTIAAGTNLDQVALRDMHQTTGRRWIHNAAESISLFVSGTKAKIKDTFKIIAARGNIQMQAQDGEIEATAQQDVTITSVNGKVIIQAPKEILLAAGGGYIRIGKDIEVHNPGKQSQKAAGFALSGPTSSHPSLPNLPKSDSPDWLDLDLNGYQGLPIKGAGYTVRFADGTQRKGVLDSDGYARETRIPPGTAQVMYENAPAAKDTALPGAGETLGRLGQAASAEGQPSAKDKHNGNKN